MDYVFFHPFADSQQFVSDETINGCMDFAAYVKQKSKRTDGKAKTYVQIAHNPYSGGGLKAYGTDVMLYVCGHGDKNANQLVGMTSHSSEPLVNVGNSKVDYCSTKFASGWRYALLAGDLIKVLQWEGLNREVKEIRLWACRGYASDFAKLLAALCHEGNEKEPAPFPKAKIMAYDGDVSFGTGGHKECTIDGQMNTSKAKGLLKEVKGFW
jgi:hypothetical protein